MTLMRRTLIMCVHKGWLSSEAHSRSAVSKSWPESECVLITPSPRLNLLHFLQCAINIHTAVPTHWAGLIVWLKMSPRCSIKDGSVGNTVRGHYSFYLCTYMSVNILSSKTVFCFFCLQIMSALHIDNLHKQWILMDWRWLPNSKILNNM